MKSGDTTWVNGQILCCKIVYQSDTNGISCGSSNLSPASQNIGLYCDQATVDALSKSSKIKSVNGA